MSPSAVSGWLLAVHCGAGCYGISSEAAYISLLRSSLEDTHGVILSATVPPTAAQIAVRLLQSFEHSALSNAGFGSNLSEEGRVECEASVVCGQTHLVSCCGAVRGVKEPSALALKLLEQVEQGNENSTFAFGRQPPLVVVGEHARQLARDFGLETAGEDATVLEKYQVSAKAQDDWLKWHRRFQDKGKNDEKEVHLDTVGAICMDPRGNVAAALSSGGVAYKVPGRLGLAACPRMGCDASNGVKRAKTCRKRKRSDHRAMTNAYAIACTGRGEHFIRSNFAGKLIPRLSKDATLERALRKTFIEARKENGGVMIEGGVLALISPKDDEPNDGNEVRRIQLGAAFTTPCMGVGYLQCSGRGKAEAHVQILRQTGSCDVADLATDRLSLSTHVSYL